MYRLLPAVGILATPLCQSVISGAISDGYQLDPVVLTLVPYLCAYRLYFKAAQAHTLHTSNGFGEDKAG